MASLDKDYDFLFSLGITGEVGSEQVDRFTEDMDPLRAFSNITLADKKIRLSIEYLSKLAECSRKYLYLDSSYSWKTKYRQLDGTMIIYDVTNSKSFTSARKILTDIKKFRSYSYGAYGEKVLIGINSHKRNDRQVSTKTGKSLADSFGIPFAELTTGKDINLRKIVNDLAAAVLNKKIYKSLFKISANLEELTPITPHIIDIFKTAMQNGTGIVHELRLMVAGHQGVGKTTVTKGLLKESKPREEETSTDGIDIYIGWCDIDLTTGFWLLGGKKKTVEVYRKLAKLLVSIQQQLDNCNSNEKVSSIGEDKDKEMAVWKKLVNFFHRPSTRKGTQTRSLASSALNSSDSETATGIDTPEIDLEATTKCITPDFILKKALECASDTVDPRDTAPVQIWDFGGQVVFYTTHQTFLSCRCIYLLVFDLSKGLQDKVQDIGLIPDGSTDPTVIEFLVFWVNSIITYAGGTYLGFPKIIFVGTHLDQIPLPERENKVKAMFEEIRKYFDSHIGSEHLIIDSNFCLNAKNIDDMGYDALREKIFATAISQPFWGERRPTSWLSLETTLTNLRQSGMKILSLAQIELINQASLIHVIPKNDLDVFLQFQHLQGNLLFFPEESLREYVILNPAWLIDALKTFITGERFCTGDGIKNEMWINASTYGLLPFATIDKLWNRKENAELLDHKSHLLKTMERLDLLAKPKIYSLNGEDDIADYYLVPCMITNAKSPEEIAKIIPIDRATCMLLIFIGGFLPPAIFYRLVAACLTMWPLLQHEQSSLLYNGFCGFRLDHCHRLFLLQKRNKILAYICHTRDINAISNTLCRGVREFATSALERITNVYNQYHADDKTKSTGLHIRNILFTVEFPCCAHHLDCTVSKTRAENMEEQLCVHHKQALTHIWMKAKEKVEDTEYVPEYSSCSTECQGLEADIMKRCPTDQDLARLSRHLLSSPDILGVSLNVPQEIIDNIRCSYFEKHEQNFRVLHHWRDSRKTTLKTLLAALSLSQDSDIHVMCKIYRQKKPRDDSDFLTNQLFAVPSTEKLDALADRITPYEAFYLGIDLGIDFVKLEQIRVSYPNNSLKQIREILRYWRSNSKVRPTYNMLQTGMSEAGIQCTVLQELVECEFISLSDDEI